MSSVFRTSFMVPSNLDLKFNMEHASNCVRFLHLSQSSSFTTTKLVIDQTTFSNATAARPRCLAPEQLRAVKLEFKHMLELVIEQP